MRDGVTSDAVDVKKTTRSYCGRLEVVWLILEMVEPVKPEWRGKVWKFAGSGLFEDGAELLDG